MAAGCDVGGGDYCDDRCVELATLVAGELTDVGAQVDRRPRHRRLAQWPWSWVLISSCETCSGVRVLAGRSAPEPCATGVM